MFPLRVSASLRETSFPDHHRSIPPSRQPIADLSRTDVPSEGEMRMIRRTFPKEIPTALIPDYWRPKLRD